MIEPSWCAVARSYIGLREYPGSSNNPTIMGWLKNMGWAWLGGDSVPWCGSFLSHCMKRVGITPPKAGYRALSWATWGEPCHSQVGAVGVKSRKGGGHVGLIVGISADKTKYYLLAGNQNDSVNISKFSVSDFDAIRWPATCVQTNIPLPILGGALSNARED